MKKRVLAIAMTLAMTLSLLPTSALAAEDIEEESTVVQQEVDVKSEDTVVEETTHDIRDDDTVVVWTC